MARTDNPAYVTVHNRLRRDRGPASEYRCAAHHHWAETWAYSGLAENELIGRHSSRNRYTYEFRYSADPNDYIPLCRETHNRLDAFHRNAANSITGDEDESGVWLL